MHLSLGVIQATDFMRHYCTQLQLSTHIEAAARLIVEKASKSPSFVSLGRPATLAAASILLASQSSGECRTIKEVSGTVGVGVETIRRTYDKLQRNGNTLFV